MFQKLNLSQRILLAYVGVVILFAALLYPLSSHMVHAIVKKAIIERSNELIEKIKNEPDDEALVQKLKDQKYLIFFRVSLITNEHKLLYDSYTKRLLGPKFNQQLALNHPEVEEAFKTGSGYYEGESKTLKQRFVYIAKAFDFHGKTYILRNAFPYKFVGELTRDVEFGLGGLAITALLLSSLLTWVIIHRLTQPIHKIIADIKPFQEGDSVVFPELQITNRAHDDIKKLGFTLNLLAAKVRSQIDTLTSERNETSTILESLVEGVVAVDDKLNVTYVNEMALNILGCTRDELLNKPFSVIQQRDCLALLVECQHAKKLISDTLQLKREDGSKLYLDIVAVPKGPSSGAILVLDDKTEHYKLLEMRKDFIANASHELKTPITIIRGFAETLHDNPNLPPDTYLSVTNRILQNCKRMAELVKDLLVLTDVENIPHSRLMECDLDDLVEHCCQMIKDLYPDATVKIDKKNKDPLHLIGDPSLLEMAIINLLENAAKYSNHPAHITVTLDKKGDRIQLVVADKGIGIPAKDLENIFQRFYTVDKTHSRKLGGSGLGLSLVETIVEKHGGKISVASEVGKGTAFTVSLPIGELNS